MLPCLSQSCIAPDRGKRKQPEALRRRRRSYGRSRRKECRRVDDDDGEEQEDHDVTCSTTASFVSKSVQTPAPLGWSQVGAGFRVGGAPGNPAFGLFYGQTGYFDPEDVLTVY
jgi:hypothetical protein